MDPGVKATSYLEIVESTATQPASGVVIDEAPFSIFVNGQEWVTLMCTPVALEDLALGFLYAEGIIDSLDDVAGLDITHHNQMADVWLRDRHRALPQRRIITSGCGGGITFTHLAASRAPVQSGRQLTLPQIFALMRQLQQAAILYRRSRGVHTSALGDGDRLLITAEDVGRHNTLDKLLGAALRRGLPTQDTILLTTGRISSEMLRKSADMGIPIVISRTSPTSLSLELARAWHITMIGYVRSRGLRIYAGAQRVYLNGSRPPGYETFFSAEVTSDGIPHNG